MKIGILYSHLKEQGGAESVILKQLELLHHNGHSVRCYFAYVDKKLVKTASNPHCFTQSYFSSPIPNNHIMRIILSIPFAPLTLNSLKQIDVLLCHGYGPAPWIGYNLKKLKKKKYVSYIHSPPRFLYLSPKERSLWRFDDTRDLIYWLSRLSGSILKQLDHLSILNSDRVIANSYFTAKRVKAIYAIKPIVCYPPVDIHTFKPLKKEEIHKTRSKFSWPLILSTGRLAAIKRWEWLIQMMPHITRTFPSTTLAFTGEVTKENINYVQKLLKLANVLGVSKNIRFLGFQPLEKLVELYNAADVYVYPVPREDFGLGPVEAMACGTPAVVWDDGAGPCETVISGKTGFRAEPYDIGDFAEKTLKAIDIGKDSMRSFAYNYVKENFSCEKHLHSLETVLEKL